MEIETVVDTTSVEIDTPREKRVRKSVSRLSDVYDKTFDLKSDRIVKPVVGSGTKLGDIIRFQDASHRCKINGELAKNIHLLCYRTIGKANKRMSSIKKFNGFDENDDGESKKRLALMDKMKIEELKLICDLFNVHPSGKMKKDIAVGLVEYLRCPFETGSENFRTSALKRKMKGGKAGKKAKIGTKTKHAKSDLEDIEMESSFENEEEKSDTHIDDSVSMPNKENEAKAKTKSPKKRKEIIKEKGDPVKRTIKKKKLATSLEQPLQESSQQQNGDEEVVNSFSSSQSEILSDTLLKEKIATILNGADLSKITLNQVCNGVIQQFPDVDLELRRPHIKSLVKQVLDQA